jgi:hypothetical protein
MLLVFSLNTISLFAQRTDSVIHVPDSARQELRKTVTAEFQQWKDSMEGVRIKRNVAKNGKPLNEFLSEMADREKADKRQLTFRIGLGVLFLTALVVGLARRRKRS